jgi:hypothetical protein
MRRTLVLPALFAPVLLICLAGCPSKGPDKKKPWVVVLDEVATRAAAVQRAEELARAHPEKLQDAAALSVTEKIGVVRHLVVSGGFRDKPEAETLARELSKSSSARLGVISVTGLRMAEDRALADSSAPEEVEFIEKLASRLPAPSGTRRLYSFLLLRDPEKAGRYHQGSFGRAAPLRWERRFSQLGWKATAEATYRPRGSQDDREAVRVFVGWLNPGVDGAEMLKKTYNFLWDHRSPTEEEWEKILKQEEQERRQRKRKRKRSRGRQVKKAPEPELQVELREPPGAIDRVLFWGPAKVHPVERVTFLPFKDTDGETPFCSAWIALGPQKEAVILVLFVDEEAAKSLLAPRTLGRASGLAHSVYLKSAWQVLPDVSIEGEEMAYLGMDRLSRWLDRKRRRLDWAKAHGETPVLGAGYITGEAWWGITWVDLGSTPVAEAAFESAYIDPRKEELQKMLKSRRSVPYEMGVSLQEVGDVTGWHFKGAAQGHVQELYFRKDTALWLLQATQAKKGGIQPQDLLARVELLQIWNQPEK